MFGAGLSGSYSKSDTKSKSKSRFWTDKQKLAERGLGEYFKGVVDQEGNLKQVTPYEGQLAGTYTPESMQALFNQAGAYGRGEAAPLFAHYRQYSDPAQRQAQIQQRLEARRQFLTPERERADAEMKAKMRSMGLTHSSDMLKKQADVEMQRQAEEDLIASDLMDRYEELGFQASEAALTSMREIGSMDYQIKNAGLEAQFNEWLRQQPENNPYIQQIMAYLGLQGVAETMGKASTTSWSVSGSASYGAPQGQQQGGTR